MNVIITSCCIKEDLPYPYVHYPSHYGTFFTFSEAEDSQQYFCSCSQQAISNYLEYRHSNIVDFDNTNPLRCAPLDSFAFSESIAEMSLNEDLENILTFKEELCHRCNVSTPSGEYCASMYGGKFKQKFGWYINQNFYRLGVTPLDQHIISDICPDEIKNKAELKHFLHEQVFAHSQGEKVSDTLENLQKKASTLYREINSHIENITRKEFGVRKIGDRWISETILFNIITKLYPNEKILRHHRPDWLNGLELDIFIEGKNMAFEYQGQQHYHPIKAWGGESAFRSLVQRDHKKALICKKLGVSLLPIKFTEPLSEEHIKKRINSFLTKKHGAP